MDTAASSGSSTSAEVFQRVGRESALRQPGRWALRHKDRELVLEFDDADGRSHTERYPIVALDGKRLELLARPTCRRAS